MIYHTYRECLGMEPVAGSIAVAAGGKDSDRKEDCQIQNTIRRLRLVMIKNPLNTVITFPPYHEK